MSHEDESTTRVTRGALRRRSIDQDTSLGTPKKSTKKLTLLDSIEESSKSSLDSNKEEGTTLKGKKETAANKTGQKLKDSFAKKGSRSRSSSLTEENLVSLDASLDVRRTPRRRPSQEHSTPQTAPTVAKRATRSNSTSEESSQVPSVNVTPVVSSKSRLSVPPPTIAEDDEKDEKSSSPNLQVSLSELDIRKLRSRSISKSPIPKGSPTGKMSHNLSSKQDNATVATETNEFKEGESTSDNEETPGLQKTIPIESKDTTNVTDQAELVKESEPLKKAETDTKKIQTALECGSTSPMKSASRTSFVADNEINPKNGNSDHEENIPQVADTLKSTPSRESLDKNSVSTGGALTHSKSVTFDRTLTPDRKNHSSYPKTPVGTANKQSKLSNSEKLLENSSKEADTTAETMDIDETLNRSCEASDQTKEPTVEQQTSKKNNDVKQDMSVKLLDQPIKHLEKAVDTTLCAIVDEVRNNLNEADLSISILETPRPSEKHKSHFAKLREASCSTPLESIKEKDRTSPIKASNVSPKTTNSKTPDKQKRLSGISELSKSWSKAVKGSGGDKGIDVFSIRKQAEEQRKDDETKAFNESLKRKSSERSPSKCKRHTREPESTDEEESGGSEDKTSFVEDEAMEMDNYQSGDSLDSETRAEMRDNEIPIDVESIGSNDSSENSVAEEDDDDEDSNDSFIASEDDEMELLEGSGDDLSSASSSKKSNKKKRKRIIENLDSSDDSAANVSKTNTTISSKNKSLEAQRNSETQLQNFSSNSDTKLSNASNKSNSHQSSPTKKSNSESQQKNSPAQSSTKDSSRSPDKLNISKSTLQQNSPDKICKSVEQDMNSPLKSTRKNESRDSHNQKSVSPIKILHKNSDTKPTNDTNESILQQNSENKSKSDSQQKDSPLRSPVRKDTSLNMQEQNSKFDSSLRNSSKTPDRKLKNKNDSIPQKNSPCKKPKSDSQQNSPSKSKLSNTDSEADNISLSKSPDQKTLKSPIQQDSKSKLLESSNKILHQDDETSSSKSTPFLIDGEIIKSRKSLPTLALISADFYSPNKSSKNNTINTFSILDDTVKPDKDKNTLNTKDKFKSLVSNPAAVALAKKNKRAFLNVENASAEMENKRTSLASKYDSSQEGTTSINKEDTIDKAELLNKEESDKAVVEPMEVEETDTAETNQQMLKTKSIAKKPKDLSEFDHEAILSRCNEIVRVDKEKKRELATRKQKKKDEKRHQREDESNENIDADNTAEQKKKKKKKKKIVNYLLEELGETREQQLLKAIQRKTARLEAKRERKRIKKAAKLQNQLNKENQEALVCKKTSGIGTKFSKTAKKKDNILEQLSEKCDVEIKPQPDVRLAVSAFSVYKEQISELKNVVKHGKKKNKELKEKNQQQSAVEEVQQALSSEKGKTKEKKKLKNAENSIIVAKSKKSDNSSTQEKTHESQDNEVKATIGEKIKNDRKSLKHKHKETLNEITEVHKTLDNKTLEIRKHEKEKNKEHKTKKKTKHDHPKINDAPGEKLVPLVEESAILKRSISEPVTKTIKKQKLSHQDSLPFGVSEEAITPPRKASSTLKALSRLESGFVEEQVTPDHQLLKRNRGFKEEPLTPKPVGFRVSNILPVGREEFALKADVARRKKNKHSHNPTRIQPENVKEPVKTLPLPIWTRSGTFEVEELTARNGKTSGKKSQSHTNDTKNCIPVNGSEVRHSATEFFTKPLAVTKKKNSDKQTGKATCIDPATVSKEVINFKKQAIFDKNAHLREKKLKR